MVDTNVFGFSIDVLIQWLFVGLAFLSGYTILSINFNQFMCVCMRHVYVSVFSVSVTHLYLILVVFFCQ